MSRTAGAVPYVWTSLLRRSRFLALASATLAVGIAALTAALILVDALLWRSPPFADPGRLVAYGGLHGGSHAAFASTRFMQAMTGLPGATSHGVTLQPRTANALLGPRRWLLQVQRVDAGFLATLGIRAAAGQVLDGRGGAMVSFAFWQRYMGGRPPASGTLLTIDGESLPVRGVLPEGYRFLGHVDAVVDGSPDDRRPDYAENLVAVARLAPTTDIETFSRSVRARGAASPGFGPSRSDNLGAIALDDFLSRHARPTVLAFLASAGLVLAIASINVSNLILARGLGRARSVAVRMALGAHATTAWSFALADALAVGALGVLIGIPLGTWFVLGFRDAIPDEWLTSSLPLTLTDRVRTLASLAAVGVVLIAAAGASVHDRLQDLLREHVAVDGRPGLERASQRARRGMVLVQSALAALLLAIGVSSLMRWQRLEGSASGFDPRGGMTGEMVVDTTAYPGRDDVVRLAEALRTPSSGTADVALTTLLPLGNNFVMPFLDASGEVHYTQYALNTPGAAQAMGLRKLAGRWLDAGDRVDSLPVAMVNQALLDELHLREGDVLRSASPVAKTAPVRIVGVVANTRSPGPSVRSVATVFLPLAQVDPAIYAYIRPLMPIYAVWHDAPGSVTSPQGVEQRLAHAAPALVMGAPTPLARLIRDARSGVRRDAALSSTLALSALFLAIIGIASSQSVETVARRRDLALRLALGASKRRLVVAVAGCHLRLTAAGAVIGLSVALLPFGAPLARDIPPCALAIAAGIFVAVALAATLIPAWRAATIDPAGVLRGD